MSIPALQLRKCSKCKEESPLFDWPTDGNVCKKCKAKKGKADYAKRTGKVGTGWRDHNFNMDKK